MENSHIEWTDHTWNPWIGCTKVSPGCLHCYAEARDKRFAGGQHWGHGAPRQRTADANWAKPLFWNSVAAAGNFRLCPECGWRGDVRMINPREICPTHGCLGFLSDMLAVRPRVFCASLADWLDDEVEVEWFADSLDLVRHTPNLDWLLLTKRPENFFARVSAALKFCDNEPGQEYDELSTWLHDWLTGRAPLNVWIGTTVEDQTRANERIPFLRSIPARVRFLSCEPLIGLVGLVEWLGNPVQQAIAHHYRTGHEAAGDGYQWNCEVCEAAGDADEPSKINWIICGGESGPSARPMRQDWARSLRDQCEAANVAFFFKQWGEFRPSADDDSMMDCIGKKAAGRLLDGALHDALPNNQALPQGGK